jgi:aminopeptidase 2
VAYSPERLTALGKEAASPNSSFTVEDRMGLVSDAMVLAKSGHAKTSGALNLVKALKNEQECTYLLYVVPIGETRFPNKEL